jgi:hypothetical protein
MGRKINSPYRAKRFLKTLLPRVARVPESARFTLGFLILRFQRRKQEMELNRYGFNGVEADACKRDSIWGLPRVSGADALNPGLSYVIPPGSRGGAAMSCE